MNLPLRMSTCTAAKSWQELEMQNLWESSEDSRDKAWELLLRATKRRCLKHPLQKHINIGTTTIWKTVIAEIFTATRSGKFPWLIMFLPVPEFPYSSSGINASNLNADGTGERRGFCTVVDSHSCLCSLPEEQLKQRIHCFKMGQQDKWFSLPLTLKRSYLKSPVGIKTYLTDPFFEWR